MAAAAQAGGGQWGGSGGHAGDERECAAGIGAGPQQARGSGERAMGLEGRALRRQEAKGSGEGRAHRMVHAGLGRQEAGRCGRGRTAMPTAPNVIQGTGPHDTMPPGIKSSTA